MENEEIIDQTDIDLPGREARISRLAVASVVFGVLGPFTAGAMWILSLNDFLTVPNPIITAIFSCGLTWILGLVFGIKSLGQICRSQGKLFGREYAIAGIFISAAWLLLIFLGVLLPILYYVNS